MTGITTYFSVITPNIMVSIFQSKDTEWQIGLSNKTQPFVAYKKDITLAKTNKRVKRQD
jgi:hypothetical protein